MIELDIDASGVDGSHLILKTAIRAGIRQKLARSVEQVEGVVYRYEADDTLIPLVRFNDSGAYVELIPIETWEHDLYV